MILTLLNSGTEVDFDPATRRGRLVPRPLGRARFLAAQEQVNSKLGLDHSAAASVATLSADQPGAATQDRAIETRRARIRAITAKFLERQLRQPGGWSLAEMLEWQAAHSPA